MRSSLALLCLASLASAIPLRIGARLGYLADRGRERDSTFVSLTVLDSSHEPQGTVWSVAIRDSLIGGDRIRLDTAKLLIQGAHAMWAHASCLLGWDLYPAQQNQFAYDWQAPGELWGSEIGWGEIAFGCEASYVGSPDFSQINSYSIAPAGYRLVGIFEASMPFPLPQGVWSQDTGWTRFRDPYSREEWILRSFDGLDLRSTPPELPGSTRNVNPAPGMTWTWEIAESPFVLTGDPAHPQSRKIVQWRFVQALADSSGWTRWKIVQRTDTDSGTVEIREGQVRIDLTNDAVQVDGGLIEELAWGCIRPWFALRSDSLLVAEATSGFRWGMGPPSGRAATYWLRESVGLDSLVSIRAAAVNSATLAYRGYTWIRLLSFDQAVFRTAGLHSSRPRGAQPISLLTPQQVLGMLRADPSCRVRISALSGRTWDVRADEAERLFGRLHGVYVFQLTAPGIHSSGRILLP